MILAMFAALLVAQPVESPPPEESIEAAVDAVEAAAEQAEEAAEAAEEAGEQVEEAAEAAEEAAEAAVEASENAGDQVCRRRHYYDDFGRPRSRKVCRSR